MIARPFLLYFRYYFLFFRVDIPKPCEIFNMVGTMLMYVSYNIHLICNAKPNFEYNQP